jgi:hypothetical protein
MDASKRAYLYREIRKRIDRRADRRIPRHWHAIFHIARRSDE